MRCHSDACCQGRKPCPTPCACEVPDEGMSPGASALIAVTAWALLTVAVFAISGLIAGIFYNA